MFGRKQYTLGSLAAHASLDRRDSSLKALDAEANRLYGREANTLFGAEVRRRFAPEIEAAKRHYARTEVNKIREYSGYIAAGAGLLMTYASSGYEVPVSLAVGAISAAAAYFTLPTALDKFEDFVAKTAEVQPRIELRAVY